MVNTILKTKVYIPPPRPRLVLRQRLTELLNASLEHKLMLVSAPAGFGKTTLISEWSRAVAPDIRVAWFSVDRGDNDPARFWTYFITALGELQAGLSDKALSLLQSPQPMPIESMITALINDLINISANLVLVLDDYHLIESQPIQNAMDFLLDHLPSHLHLIIATRSDPPLPLVHLRGQGALVEIGADELRFTLDEATAFFNQVMGLSLSSNDIAALNERAEGWIAGLQIGALSIQGKTDIPRFIKDFTGSHHHIMDYLISEVLQQQPGNIRDFLLKTSILDRLSAPLCDAVTGRSDSHEVLPALERGNLFIVPLDESRQWYRYEHLFSDLLRHQLGEISGFQPVAPLHDRASRWYEARGLSADAAHHALVAQDWERAADLIGNLSDDLLKHGQVTTLLGLAETLPKDILHAHPELCNDYCWTLMLTGQIDAAEACLKQAEQNARDNPALLSHITAMQANVARIRGDNKRTIELSVQALSLLPQDDVEKRFTIALTLGIAHWQAGHLGEAHEAFTEAEQNAHQSDNPMGKAITESFLGALEATFGRLHRAAELLRGVVRSDPSPASALGRIYLGALLYERNELTEAADQVQHGIQLSLQSGGSEIQMSAYRVIAAIQQSLNDSGGALDSLQKLDNLARSTTVSSFEHARNASIHVLIALAQGDLSTAMEWAERIEEDGDTSPFYAQLNLTPARVLIAQKRKTEASEDLKKRHQQAVEGNWQYGQIEIRVLQALAATDPVSSLAFITDALQQAQPEGYMRIFVDKGEKLITLLNQAKRRGIATDYVTKILAVLQEEVKTRRLLGKTAIQLYAKSQTQPLSPREWEIAEAIAQGLNNRDISSILFISVRTVDAHVRNILDKLELSSRSQVAIWFMDHKSPTE